MELGVDRLAAQLTGPLAPAWLVAGSEALLVLEACDAIRAAARAQGIAEREVFDLEGDARRWDFAPVVATLQAPGLFAARRLVELRIAGGKPGKDGAAIIQDFCAAPPADVTLLVVAGDWSKAHAGKWSDAIARTGHAVIAWPVKPHELPGWIERRLRARGLRADREGVQLLAQRVEGNLLAAAQEIDKLALLAEPGEALAASRMADLVADSARYDVFRLVDAALNGQPAQVSRMLRGLRGEGSAVPALMGMVVMELNRLAALARARNLAAEFKAQRIWDSKQAAYQRALQRHPAPRWDTFLAAAGRVDRMSKGREAGDAWRELERLLVALATPAAGSLLAA